MNIIKVIFCNHTSQHCLTNFNTSYIDKLAKGMNPDKYTLWQCERCGKIIKKKNKEKASTFNWINIRVKEGQK